MSFKSVFQQILKKREQGINVGIPSFCTANMAVWEAILQYAKDTGCCVLIEATSNQCNQFGGYTGMTPFIFHKRIRAMAKSMGLSQASVMLGGDHLGPLPWHDLPANEAMRRAETLVHDFVLAGFEKIHLDTSMYLADDDRSQPLSIDTIAARGVRLYQAAMKAMDELRDVQPNAAHPVFVIGSEVPPAGGMVDGNGTKITLAADTEEMLQAYARQFTSIGLESAWDHIAALVVQLGAEYSNTIVYRYDSKKAAPLFSVLNGHPSLLFEGHSTDFQSVQSLSRMIEDGVAILKVGPAMTYAYREALSCLAYMEEELIADDSKRSYFREVLYSVMKNDHSNYKSHYNENIMSEDLLIKYSFLDRARYYLNNDIVQKSIQTLMNNMNNVVIPKCMLHQYMPMQYRRLVDNNIPISAQILVMDYIRLQIEVYAEATRIQELHS